jgi:hypothetical protein
MPRGRPPKVINGPRSASALDDVVREEAEAAETRGGAMPPPPIPNPKKDEPRPAKPAFPSRFVSAHPNYSLTLNDPIQLPDGSMKDRKFSVVFQDGFLDITRSRYPVAPERVSALIVKSPSFGLGRSFWDSDVATAAAEEAEKNALLEKVAAAKADPKLREALKATLDGDFQMD